MLILYIKPGTHCCSLRPSRLFGSGVGPQGYQTVVERHVYHRVVSGVPRDTQTSVSWSHTRVQILTDPRVRARVG